MGWNIFLNVFWTGHWPLSWKFKSFWGDVELVWYLLIRLQMFPLCPKQNTARLPGSKTKNKAKNGINTVTGSPHTQTVSMRGGSRRTGSSRTAAGRAAAAARSPRGCTVSGRPAPAPSPPPSWPPGWTPSGRRPSGGASSCSGGSGTRSWPESLWAWGRPPGRRAPDRTGTAGGWSGAPARRPAHERRPPWSASCAAWAGPGSSRPPCWSLKGGRTESVSSCFSCCCNSCCCRRCCCFGWAATICCFQERMDKTQHCSV